MNQSKRLSNEQKELLIRYSLVPDNWKVINENTKFLEVVSRRSGQRRILKKS